MAELLREGKLELSKPIDRRDLPRRLPAQQAQGHPRGAAGDPARDSGARPSRTSTTTQWSYCSGGGAGLPIERPDLTAEISRRRVERAKALEVDTLVSACVWSERPLGEQGEPQEIEVVDLMELVAESAGLED